MESIQQRLQRRIAKRASEITELEQSRLWYKDGRNYDAVWGIDVILKPLREDQLLDKSIIRSVYWGV
jgi:hypothetical protein